MGTVNVRYIGPQTAVDLDLRGVEFDDPAKREPVGHGEVVAVSTEVAYGAPGVEREDGTVTAGYTGLLDQPDNWELADKPKAKKKTPDDTTEPVGPDTEGDD